MAAVDWTKGSTGKGHLKFGYERVMLGFLSRIRFNVSQY